LLHYTARSIPCEKLVSGGGIIGTMYQLLLGFGTIVISVTGSMIFFRVKARSKKR
jgi:hypothetical protein